MTQTIKLLSPSSAFAMVSLLFLSSFSGIKAANAQNAYKRGLIPELQVNANASEAVNSQRSVEAEILIVKTENKAIEALQRILSKKKGQPEEPDLLYRLAELYMRRSKSGRFFELHQNVKTSTMSSFPIPNLKGADEIKKAIAIYNRIENNFKKYPEMDSVLFNNAFAHQQINLSRVAESLYKKLIEQFSKSHLLPDGLLALSELLYDQQRFADALTYYRKLEAFPESRVYSYGMYKMAWTYYNLKDTQNGVQKLLLVVKLNPPGNKASRSYNLREEALRDLTVFIGDTIGPAGIYPFFAKITTEEELGQAILVTARLYDTYSRFKEIPIFIDEYNQKHPLSSVLVKTNLILVNSYEILKKRENVLEKLKTASELCRAGSAWHKLQSPENIAESCQKNFREESLEISKKWWEIWTKNKSHKEFSSLTERALRLILDLDDEKAPDIKTRFALAELLFQTEKFDESSSQYKTVADTTKDPILSHDSSYAALFAIEKAIERAPEKTDEKTLERTAERTQRLTSRKALVQLYLQRHPKGEHFLPIKFKWALVLYEEGKLEDSMKVLEELTSLTAVSGTRPPDLTVKTKAEDLILDIFNLQKNFTQLKLKAKEFSSKTPNPERSQALHKIYEEAQYSEAQALSTQGNKAKAAEALLQFTKDHPTSAMNLEAHWQALSLYYAEGRLHEGSNLSLDFFAKNPKDKRALDALKEAVNSKIELGELLESAELLQKLALLEPSHSEVHLIKAAQFYWMEGKKPASRRIYTQLLKTSTTPEKKNDYQNLLHSTFSKVDQESPEYRAFLQGLIDQGVEPFATEFLISKAGKLLESNKRSEAFELARKIISRNVDSDLKARAALIQARILEDEFKSQSVKSSSEERFSLVLSMKSERMEKALTSYLSVLRISNHIETRIQALNGIDRVYTNYIESLSDLRGPASVSEADMAAIKGELLKTLDPVKARQAENKLEISRLTKQTIKSETQSWSSLPVTETPAPKLTDLPSDHLVAFIPETWSVNEGRWIELKSSSAQASNPTCQSVTSMKSPTMNEALRVTSLCALASPHGRGPHLETFRGNINHLLRDTQTRTFGLFYLSLLSEQQGLNEKALWAAERAVVTLKDPKQGYEPLWYQEFRSKVKSRGWQEVQEDFQKITDLKTSSPQIDQLKALQFFRIADYSKTLDVLSALNTEELDRSNMTLLLSETYAQKGDIDRAVSTIRKSQLKNSAEGWIQTGRIFESFKPNIGKAREAYTQAQKVSADPEQKKWLERKLDYLSRMGVTES
ncbi:MAG: tetratricopeptide repeat protein [Bdellovibrionaceae bacterium]|nr:tetratricopeptide repeat protein [Pseudobdellovibrionaceae bacterium]